MFKDYYKILGVSQQASIREIKSAYRTMSIKWHPDKNQDADVTKIMQDINEAYTILKDEAKRHRYDQEYFRFAQQFPKQEYKSEQRSEKTSHSSWSYDYDIQDETLKEDIKTARQYAKELVEEFLRSLKETSKIAAKGAWEKTKGYVYIGIFLMIFGVIIQTCLQNQNNSDYMGYDYATLSSAEHPAISEAAVIVKSTQVVKSFQAPVSWKKHFISNGAFSISVPKTVELRNKNKEIDMFCNSNIVVFQQKDLSTNSSKAFKHYCRIMIQHTVGNANDFLRYNETEKIDHKTKSFFRELVVAELWHYKLIDEPTYNWIDINGTKAVEIKYRRSGTDKYTTTCTMYLLFNYNEMVKMIVSYREQEKQMWLPDLDNIIKTFKWK